METNSTQALRGTFAQSKRSLSAFRLNVGGKPQDIAGPCVFLASSASDYINGYTIAVDDWLVSSLIGFYSKLRVCSNLAGR
ncbi:SDR family oxidoreductase [Vibrio lentus]|nr:SDR family oxidoreductase [Vibrio lentus]